MNNKRWLSTIAVWIVVGASRLVAVRGQDLEPRAYSVSPLGVNIVVMAYGRSSGDLVFDPTLPVEDASGKINSGTLGYVRSIGLLRRSGNVGAVFPYVWGTAQGLLAGVPTSPYLDELGQQLLEGHRSRQQTQVQAGHSP